jgi:hypothetical protein
MQDMSKISIPPLNFFDVSNDNYIDRVSDPKAQPIPDIQRPTIQTKLGPATEDLGLSTSPGSMNAMKTGAHAPTRSPWAEISNPMPTHESGLSQMPIDLANMAANMVQDNSYDAYFASFHRQWPILHKSSFLSGNAPLELRCTVTLINTFLKNNDVGSRMRMISLNKWLLGKTYAMVLEVC